MISYCALCYLNEYICSRANTLLRILMKVNSIYLESNSTFSNYITDWANTAGVNVVDYDHKAEELPEGLLLINAKLRQVGCVGAQPGDMS